MSFEVSKLKAKVMAKSSPQAEEYVEVILACAIEWLKEESALSESMAVKTGVPFALGIIEPMIKPVIDQIDGKVG